MLSTFDSLQHGFLNVRANWHLLVVLFLQTLVISVISLLGMMPIFLVLGIAFVRGITAEIGEFGPGVLWERLLEAGPPLLFAFLVVALIWTFAFVVYCYFQGGILGTLAAGETQARGQAPRWPAFQAFSRESFSRLAGRLTWPVFWLLNLFFAIALALLCAFALLGVGLVMMFEESPVALGVAGCSTLLVLAVALALTAAWMQLALAEIATGTRGVFAAARAALAVAGRRFPGVALLFLLLVAGSFLVGIVTVPLSLVVESAARGDLTAYASGQILLSMAQWFGSSVLTLAWSAALIALVSGESEAAVG